MAIPPGLQVTRVTHLLSPEAVEFLKFLKVDFVWDSWLTADQNSTIQQFNSLGNTLNVRLG